jgi:starch phosphorylase
MYTQRSQNGGESSVQIQEQQSHLHAHWSEIRFHSVETKADEGQLTITARVYLGAVPAERIRVEVFAENPGGPPFIEQMTRGAELVGAMGGFVFQTRVPDSRAADAYTIRIVSNIDTVSSPLEEQLVLWHR